jgi:triosephosphate isomerase
MQTATQVGKPLQESTGSLGKIIIANWKSNSPDVSQWSSFPAFPRTEVVICPPPALLSQVSEKIPNIILGAQDAGEFGDLGVKYVIVGHSDRRKAGESDEVIAQKTETALKSGLKAILCVGEPKEIRDLGLESAKSFVSNQIQKDLDAVTADLYANLFIAYEPVWAISTNPGAEADTPENALEMIKFIKAILPDLGRARFIYGGSVTPENAAGFLGQREIEGALVGKASLDPEEFKKIITIADGS